MDGGLGGLALGRLLLANAARVTEETEPGRLAEGLVEGLVQALEVEAAAVVLADRPAAAAAQHGLDPGAGGELWREDGPVRACLAGGRRIVAGELLLAARWPVFAARVAGLGYRTACALPMRHAGTVTGAVGMLASAHRRPLDGPLLDLAQALADLGALALTRHRELRDRDRLVGQLEHALSSRIVIEQAKGILAERWDVSVDTAFDALRRHARSHQRRLTGLCADIVAGQPVGIPRPGP